MILLMILIKVIKCAPEVPPSRPNKAVPFTVDKHNAICTLLLLVALLI